MADIIDFDNFRRPPPDEPVEHLFDIRFVLMDGRVRAYIITLGPADQSVEPNPERLREISIMALEGCGGAVVGSRVVGRRGG